MRERLIRFMHGRYGMDSLGKFTVITGVVAMLCRLERQSDPVASVVDMYRLYLFPHILPEYL